MYGIFGKCDDCGKGVLVELTHEDDARIMANHMHAENHCFSGELTVKMTAKEETRGKRPNVRHTDAGRNHRAVSG